jgi:6,7-dimethyl-8-ribityllumazine synthase
MKKKIAIVVSEFNQEITKALLEDSLQTFIQEYKIEQQNIDIVKVPGAFEIPLVADKLASLKIYNSVLCLGSIVRGGTPHFDYICKEVTHGLMQVGLKYQKPVIFGVLTTDNIEQARQRCGLEKPQKSTKQDKYTHSKGQEFAHATCTMLNLMKDLDNK